MKILVLFCFANFAVSKIIVALLGMEIRAPPPEPLSSGANIPHTNSLGFHGSGLCACCVLFGVVKIFFGLQVVRVSCVVVSVLRLSSLGVLSVLCDFCVCAVRFFVSVQTFLVCIIGRSVGRSVGRSSILGASPR